MDKLRVAFLGTPDFAVPSLDILNNHSQVEVVQIISMPDRPIGRKQELKSPEVIQYAKMQKLNYFQTSNINKESEYIDKLKSLDIDIFIVLAFAQFLNSKVLSIPNKGCFNIHTSLLPKYRGAAPIQYAIMNGDIETGVSIQKMVKKMDAGDIVYSAKLKISDTETGGQLYSRLKFKAALALNDFINQLVSNNDLTYKIQDETHVSFAPSLSRETGHIDFKNETFNKIYNKVRALYPWPGTYCLLNNKRLKVFNIEKSHKELKPAQVIADNGCLIIGCLDGSVRLTDLQLEGKKRTSDTTLLNGLKSKEFILK